MDCGAGIQQKFPLYVWGIEITWFEHSKLCPDLSALLGQSATVLQVQ